MSFYTGTSAVAKKVQKKSETSTGFELTHDLCNTAGAMLYQLSYEASEIVCSDPIAGSSREDFYVERQLILCQLWGLNARSPGSQLHFRLSRALV